MKIDDDEKRIKIDDDFFKIPEQWDLKEDDKEKNGTAKKISPIALAVAYILIILIGIATFFLWMSVSALRVDIKNLDTKASSIDTANLPSQLMKIETALGYLSEENMKLKSELVRLRGEVDALKAKKERADAASQKQPPLKRKTTGESQRMR